MMLEERVGAFRENITNAEWISPPTWWHFKKLLKVELEWAKENPPFAKLEGGELSRTFSEGLLIGYEKALAFVESLLREPEGK